MKSYFNLLLENFRLIPEYTSLFMLSGIVNILCLFSFPKILERIIHVIETTKNEQQFFVWITIMAAVGIINIITWRLYAILSDGLIPKLMQKKTPIYLEKLAKVDYSQLIDVGTGVVLSKIERGSIAEGRMFSAIVRIIIQAFPSMLILIAVFAIYLPQFTAGLLAMAITVFGINTFLKHFADPVSDRLNHLNEQLQRNLVRIITENLLVRIYNRQSLESQKIASISAELPSLEIKNSFFRSTAYDGINLFVRILEVLAYVVIGLQVLSGQQTIAFLIMITSYLWLAWNPIANLLWNLGEINKNRAAFDSFQIFLNIPPKIIDGSQDFTFKQGQIDIQNLTFSYDGNRNIFENFDVSFESGNMTALVGHSGSGKSTLIKLLLRLYDPVEGKISFDGQDLRSIRIQTLYKHIGYLSQEPAVFDGTIRENLEYALPTIQNYDDAILWEALKKAQFDDLVKSIPKGLETEIGEKGLKLSGGEKQRLAIARIFLKDPKILILDEPTSALDSLSEAKITQVLQNVVKNRTVIVIAHRLQTVVSANKIVVIEKGKIIEQGTHGELLLQNGVYSKLVDLQQGFIRE